MRLHVPALTLLLAAPLAAGRPMQVDDLFKVKRVADPQVSSKGDLAYQVGTVDMAANRAIPKIWLKRLMIPSASSCFKILTLTAPLLNMAWG